MPTTSPLPTTSPPAAARTSPPRADRPGAALGLLAAAGNVAGVAFLVEVPGAYQPGRAVPWMEGLARHPGAAEASAVAFVLGLLAMAGWAGALGRRLGGPAAGAARAVAAGALVNAAGCVAPLVLVREVLPGCAGDLARCAPAGAALLGLTLALDALFNLLLGLGLLGLGAAQLRRGGACRATGALGILAGLATLPVALQWASPAAAGLLAVAGPLWLAYVLATSAGLLRALPGAAR